MDFTENLFADSSNNIGLVLWNFLLNILDGIELIKDFLLTSYNVGSISVFGVTIVEGFSITPLAPTGAIIVILLITGLLKGVNPV